MKILHTSDLHLGVRTDGRDRLEEQRKILNEIASIADENNVDIILVAGDIFQYSVPSAEAEDLFFEFVEKISASLRRVVIVIAGNHDDPKRLAAGAYLAEKHNIVLASDLSEPRKIKPQGVVQIVDQGRGFVKLKKGNETAVVAFLPYPIDSRIAKSVEDIFSDEEKKGFASETYEEKVRRWAAIGAKGFEKESFNVFVSHMYIVGAKREIANELETVKLGDSLAVSPAFLPKADFVALGHLHTGQCVDSKRNIFYSGAPLEVRYFDSSPEVLLVEGDKKGIKNTQKIRIKSAVKMEMVYAESVEDAKVKLAEFTSEDIIELTVKQSEPLKASEVKELKANFPCLATVRLKLVLSEGSVQDSFEKRKEMNKKELFSRFYFFKKGIQPSPELLNLFVMLAEDKNEAN